MQSKLEGGGGQFYSDRNTKRVPNQMYFGQKKLLQQGEKQKRLQKCLSTGSTNFNDLRSKSILFANSPSHHIKSSNKLCLIPMLDRPFIQQTMATERMSKRHEKRGKNSDFYSVFQFLSKCREIMTVIYQQLDKLRKQQGEDYQLFSQIVRYYQSLLGECFEKQHKIKEQNIQLHLKISALEFQKEQIKQKFAKNITEILWECQQVLKQKKEQDKINEKFAFRSFQLSPQNSREKIYQEIDSPRYGRKVFGRKESIKKDKINSPEYNEASEKANNYFSFKKLGQFVEKPTIIPQKTERPILNFMEDFGNKVKEFTQKCSRQEVDKESRIKFSVGLNSKDLGFSPRSQSSDCEFRRRTNKIKEKLANLRNPHPRS